MDHCILLLKHLSNHMHFIKKGYKRFLYTNSSDPRQRVPLNVIPIGLFMSKFSKMNLDEQNKLKMINSISLPNYFVI